MAGSSYMSTSVYVPQAKHDLGRQIRPAYTVSASFTYDVGHLPLPAVHSHWVYSVRYVL